MLHFQLDNGTANEPFGFIDRIGVTMYAGYVTCLCRHLESSGKQPMMRDAPPPKKTGYSRQASRNRYSARLAFRPAG